MLVAEPGCDVTRFLCDVTGGSLLFLPLLAELFSLGGPEPFAVLPLGLATAALSTIRKPLLTPLECTTDCLCLLADAVVFGLELKLDTPSFNALLLLA